MKDNKQKWKWFFSIAAALGMILFILGNALLDYNLSHAFSGFFVRLFGLTAGNGAQEPDLVLRKIAHVIEYALLGGAAMMLRTLAKNAGKYVSLWSPLFCILATGVLDEFFQSLSNRSSSVSDILLDFSGGLLGMGIEAGICRIIKIMKQKKIITGGQYYE